MLGQQLFKTADVAHAHQVINLLARMREMLTKMVVDGHAPARHFHFHDLGDQRHTTAAGSARLVAGFHACHRGDAVAHGRTNRTFGHVVARADLRCVWQNIHTQAGLGLSVTRGQDQELGVCRQRDAVQYHLQQRAIFAGVANQHGAQQFFAIVADHNFFVDLASLIHVLAGATVGRAAMGVADAGDVHAHQLQFGAQIRARKRCLGVACDMAGGHAGHVIPWRHQTKGLLVPRSTLADGIHVVIAGAACVVNGNTATRPDRQHTLAGQLVARTDTG